MTTQISGDTGVSQVQDNTVTSAKIVDAAIVQADLATAVLPIGVGQTWQDVKTTPGRVNGTTYTNSTGRSIELGIVVSGAAQNSIVTLTVGGIVVAQYQSYAATSQGALKATVPNGVTYAVTGASVIQSWAELR